MAQIGDCPFGFEDGQIEGYEADRDRLLVRFAFWTEKRGTFRFEKPLAVHDNGAVGVTVGSVTESRSSELLRTVLMHWQEPEGGPAATHFQFFDLDDYPILEVIAKTCSFLPEREQAPEP